MARFWVYVGDKVQGPVDIPSLRKVPGFNLLTQVCLEGDQTWRMADEVIEIKSYFLSPPRPNSFAISAGNTAPKLDLPPKAEFAPTPELEELTLPEPNTSWQNGIGPGAAPPPVGSGSGTGPTQPHGVPALRAVCDVCGYKNPRDVSVCMKCGENLKAPAPKAAASLPIPTPSSAAPTPVPSPAPSPAPTPVALDSSAASGTMVEIPIMKLVLGVTAATLVSIVLFFGIRSWKKHHAHKAAPAVPLLVAERPHLATRRSTPTTTPHYDHKPTRHKDRDDVEALPGVSKNAEPKETETASYRVVAEATPLQKRFSSPVNSPYAVKRRANQTLWTSQEEQAIRQVQQTRIYGGQRTISRNVDILMQILRDREYTTAFESGKRIYLYNDLDWNAVMKEGPVYEVRLTFSGGREADGSVKKPLHFAFSSDLERGTVEPGGQDQLRSNTLHAFFDESRIPPEDRRAIAKDTEELVLAAQPGASPLALDTVVRQFAKVYTTAALTRVADAYDLTLVKKRLAHDTHLGTDEPVDASAPVQPQGSDPMLKKGQTPVVGALPISLPGKGSDPTAKTTGGLTPSRSGPAEFRMENGAGRERTLIVRAGSKASINKIWEVLTGYDRLKQFMPDMIAGEREGQDGAAVIVHTVCLTRFAFFVFKINLHLRVIEHPREHTLEFERIAGEFESFRGSVELSTDPATHDSQVAFHATLVPSGHMMNWVLESMSRRMLVSQIEAIRAKAESN